MPCQVGREMLTHPFFWCQPYMATAKGVEHGALTAVFVDVKGGGRQVQGRVGGRCVFFHAAKIKKNEDWRVVNRK